MPEDAAPDARPVDPAVAAGEPASAAPAAPAPAPSSPSPPLTMAESDPVPAVIVRKRRLPGFDKLLEPIKRFWRSNDDSGAVTPSGPVNRTRHRDPRVLFVCTGNAARSQMAEAFAIKEGLYAESAGTWPAPAVPQEVVEAMLEKGFDLSECRPKILDQARLGAFDRVILFEARIPDASREGARIEEWDVWDPTGLPLEGHRLVANELEKRVARLAKILKGNQGKAGKGGKAQRVMA